MTQLFEQPKSFAFSIFNADGRLGRLSYAAWLFLVFFILVAGFVLIGFYISSYTSTPPSANPLNRLSQLSQLSGTISIFFLILLSVCTYMSFILTIKRLHDMDKVGWISLFIFVPCLGFLFPIYLLCLKGTNGSNTYGAPNQTKLWHYSLGWPMLLVTNSMIIVVTIFIVKFIFFSKQILNHLY